MIAQAVDKPDNLWDIVIVMKPLLQVLTKISVLFISRLKAFSEFDND